MIIRLNKNFVNNFILHSQDKIKFSVNELLIIIQEYLNLGRKIYRVTHLMKKTTERAQARTMAELTCKISRACNKKETSFAALFNLTPTELRCLRMFAKKSTVSIKEMIDELEISAGRVTHILTSLEDKKYITRRVDELDKRNHLVDLTEESKKFINQLTKKHVELHQNILDNLSDDNRKIITQVMSELIEALEDWSKNNKAKLKN